jgi:hypothetical protein
VLGLRRVCLRLSVDRFTSCSPSNAISTGAGGSSGWTKRRYVKETLIKVHCSLGISGHRTSSVNTTSSGACATSWNTWISSLEVGTVCDHRLFVKCINTLPDFRGENALCFPHCDMTSLPVGSGGSLSSAPIRAFFFSCVIPPVILCNFLNGQSRNNCQCHSSGSRLARL